LEEARRKSKNQEAEALCRLAAGYLQLRRAERENGTASLSVPEST